MCVFPKNYAFNSNDPHRYPFEGTPPNKWDFTRFDPAFFRHFEKRIAQLRDLGIEADVILFHPYDEGHWGFDRMDADRPMTAISNTSSRDSLRSETSGGRWRTNSTS